MTHSVMYLSSDELCDRLFGENKSFFYIYVYVCFVGNMAVSV